MGNLKVTLVGTGGAALTKERSCACLLFDDETLLDCGSGSLKNLRLLGEDLGRIEKILLSHLHNDHVGDLTSILWTMQLEGRKSPLEIYGPKGTEKFLTQMLRLVRTPKSFFEFKIICRDLDYERHDAFTWCMGKHVPASLAYMIDNIGSVCCSGDTRPSPQIIELARGVDLMVHDSSFLSGETGAAIKSNHSTASEAGQAAFEAGALSLILYYVLNRGLKYEQRLQQEASEKFGGKVFVARDMTVFNVP